MRKTNRVKLSKFINVTKHLANQLLYRNSHKSNEIKSNQEFTMRKSDGVRVKHEKERWVESSA